MRHTTMQPEDSLRIHPPEDSLEIHPLADKFPMMSELEYEALKADIAENGLREPLVLFEGKILDGRNRYRACQQLLREFKTTDFEGDYEQAAKRSASANLTRRHLTKSQKAMFIAKGGLAKAPSSDEAKATIRDAAKRYGVNHMTIYKAFYVFGRDQKLAEEVLKGKISVGRAESKLRANEQAVGEDVDQKSRGGESGQQPARVNADLESAVARIAALLKREVAAPTRKIVFDHLEATLKALEPPKRNRGRKPPKSRSSRPRTSQR